MGPVWSFEGWEHLAVIVMAVSALLVCVDHVY